ncbi:hypothetical protein Pelo_3736 [Pelomyxa schiedti]|nr:hypothetical protein Pelo_3736 [Pelomyxa schiedti]
MPSPNPNPKPKPHQVERSLAEQLLAAACSAAAHMWRHDGLPANLRRFRVFHFGVSPLTLSVSAEPREVYVKHIQCRKATSADLLHIIFVKKELLSHSRTRYLLIDALTGRKEILLQGTHSYTRHTANHQWWVCYDLHDKVLHVENLVEKRHICCATGDIDVPKYTGVFMYLSKINRNELVICIEREELSGKLLYIFVIDVEQSFRQEYSVITYQTCCPIPSNQHYGSSVVISSLGLAHRESGHKIGTNGLTLRTSSGQPCRTPLLSGKCMPEEEEDVDASGGMVEESPVWSWPQESSSHHPEDIWKPYMTNIFRLITPSNCTSLEHLTTLKKQGGLSTPLLDMMWWNVATAISAYRNPNRHNPTNKDGTSPIWEVALLNKHIPAHMSTPTDIYRSIMQERPTKPLHHKLHTAQSRAPSCL